MMTKYYNFKDNVTENELNEIIEILKNDGIIIFPSETVYGIACNALSSIGIDKIYKVKNRPFEKHLNIFVSNTSEINKYAYVTSKLEEKIINNYMPGAITIILKSKNVLNSIAFEDDTIGIRIPDNKIMLELLKRIDFPLATTSANISGKKSNINIDELVKDFDCKVDAIIDGGQSTLGLASTIVKVEDDKINILRQGSVEIK